MKHNLKCKSNSGSPSGFVSFSSSGLLIQKGNCPFNCGASHILFRLYLIHYGLEHGGSDLNMATQLWQIYNKALSVRQSVPQSPQLPQSSPSSPTPVAPETHENTNVISTTSSQYKHNNDTIVHLHLNQVQRSDHVKISIVHVNLRRIQFQESVKVIKM